MKAIIVFCSIMFVAGFTFLVPASFSLAITGSSPIDQGLDKVRDQFPNTSRLGKSQNASDLIINIINILLSVVMAIDVLFIIIGGYQYITSAGNAEKATTGRKTLVNALIGLAIIILAYVIVSVVNRSLTRSF